MTIAIDFDGTIHDAAHPLPDKRMGPPIQGAQEALMALKKKGHTIIIFSVWGDNGAVISKWMRFYQIPFDSITNVKPNADIFIDDRAVHFSGYWEETLKVIPLLTPLSTP